MEFRSLAHRGGATGGGRGGGGGTAAPGGWSTRARLLLALAAVSLAAWWLTPADARLRAKLRFRGQFRKDPTILLVVLDAARTDRMHLCGAERPNTPVLDGLKAAGATVACDAIAPATWATPSIASYLTGLDVPDHGVDTVTHGPLGGRSLGKLPSEVETLADQLIDQGYQTALISENPTLTNGSGLRQGYTHVAVSPKYPGADGSGVSTSLAALLGGDLDPGRPLFLTLVLSATHEPLAGSPRGVPWLPHHPSLGCWGRLSPTCKRFLAGSLPADEADAFTRQLVDLYDFAWSRNDAHLGGALSQLDAWGWRSGPWRLVIVGSSGVLLGEEGRYGTGGSVREAVARVPLLYASSAGGTELSEGISARAAWSLAATGAVPADPLPALSYGGQSGKPARGQPDLSSPRRAVGYWSGATTQTWADGVWSAVDLSGDPHEASPRELDPVSAPELSKAVDRWLSVVGWAAPEPDDSPAERGAGAEHRQ